MNKVYESFLRILAAGLQGNRPEDPVLDGEEWDLLLRLASEQEILPLILDACTALASFRAADLPVRRERQKKAFAQTMRQVAQTNEFLTLIRHAQAQGLDPVVLKGIICRSMYPKPMLRPSVDEDLLIAPEQAEAYHSFFLAEGLFADDPDADRAAADELSYHRKKSPTYIELHKSLFSQSSTAYGNLNDLFSGVLERTVTVQAGDIALRTLAPTDHMLFLICHAYKHFLHSGVGIRQIADMALFTNAYGDAIDWEWIAESCRPVHMEVFTAALFIIAKDYLTLKAIPGPFSVIDVDVQPLLEDILTGGLYGSVDIDRVHSANMTLDAVAAQKQGRNSSGILHSLFPGRDYLKSQFPFAKKHPILLPLAWVQRVVNYLMHDSKANPAKTIHIGQERVALLRQYHIIEDD